MLIYKRGIWVTKRTGEFGAKKKYALINEENKISKNIQILKNLKILLFEDTLFNIKLLKKIFKNLVLKIDHAENGEIGIEKLKNEKYDLILMDLEMPEMDGLCATQAIRAGARTPNIPIVALTAQAMRDDRERCIAAGMSAYLSKPINPELLYKTLVEQLREQSIKNGHENFH